MRPTRLIVVVQRRNPLAAAFTDKHGVVHPIEGSKGYSKRIVEQREKEREAEGIDAREQQLALRFERQIDRQLEREERERKQAEREAPIIDRIERLETDRAYLVEKLQNEPAARYLPLVQEHGRAAESGLIPWETARRYLPRRPEAYQTAIVKRGGKRWLKWEYVLDELGEDLGYRDAESFRQAIQQARRDRRALARLDSELRDAKADLRRLRARRNPLSILGGLRRWLTRA